MTNNKKIIDQFNQDLVNAYVEHWDKLDRPVVRDFLERVHSLSPTLGDDVLLRMRKAVNAFKEFAITYEVQKGVSLVFDGDQQTLSQLVIFLLEKTAYDSNKAWQLFEELDRLEVTQEDYENGIIDDIPQSHRFNQIIYSENTLSI